MIQQPVSTDVANDAAPVATPEQPRLCVDCQAPVTTKFCGHCGRKVYQRSVLVDTALQSVQVLMNIDGRWRRTLRDMFMRPGQLLQNYLKGDRHLYANPVLMLLVLTSVFVVLVEIFQIDYGQYDHDEQLSRAINWLLVFSGYFSVASNLLCAWVSHWVYPGTKWPERFIVLSYASVLSSLCTFPLLLLSYGLNNDLSDTSLTSLSFIGGCWILWGYQPSIKRTLAMLLTSLLVLGAAILLVGFLIGFYLAIVPDLREIQMMSDFIFPQAVF